MTYDQQILQLLAYVGERGISVSSLAKHLYNQNVSFFFTPDLQEIHQYVQQYLLRNSKSANSLVESTGRRGYYRLNTSGSTDARQLLLDFREAIEPTSEDASAKSSKDLSLCLFD